MPYVFSAIVAILTGLVLWLIKRPRRSMVYAVTRLPTFQRDGTPVRLYALRIWSRGNRAIDDTHVTLTLDAGYFTAIDPTEPDLIAALSVEQNRAQFDIPLLNPREWVEIVLSITNPVDGVDPKVSARAHGVTATGTTEEGYFVAPVSFAAAQIITVLLGLVSIAGVLWALRGPAPDLLGLLGKSSLDSLIHVDDSITRRLVMGRRARDARDSLAADSVTRGAPAPEQELFVLFNTSGLADLYPEYVAGGEITYWRAGYFLLTRCAVDRARCKTYARAMDELLKLPQAPSSEGFNLYLAAKMDRMLGETQKADEYLDRLRATRSLMFEYLTQHDESFDVEALGRHRSGPGPH